MYVIQPSEHEFQLIYSLSLQRSYITSKNTPKPHIYVLDAEAPYVNGFENTLYNIQRKSC